MDKGSRVNRPLNPASFIMTRLANPDNVQSILGGIPLVMMPLELSRCSTFLAFLRNFYIPISHVPVESFSGSSLLAVILSRFAAIFRELFFISTLPVSASCGMTRATGVALAQWEFFNRRKLFERLFNLTNVAAAGYNRVWHDALLRSVLCLAPAYSRYAGAFILS